MKHFIWMLCGLFISGLLLGTLSACGADQFSTCVITTSPSASPVETEAPDETEVPAEALEGDTDLTEVPVEALDGDTERRLAYGRALWDMYQLGLLPDGDELERTTDLGPQEGNQFALADVNGDGAEELIVYWTNACMAGMRGLVYGYEDGALRLELSEYPDLTFYGSGTAQAGWSHNQGWAGRFWPFTLYQYRPESGVYERAGDVDAWDLSCTEGDEALAAAFPREADADGDGLVYYLLPGDWYNRPRFPEDGSFSQLWGADPVDRAELDTWLASYTNGEEPLGVSFQDLNEENIAALGVPKPEVVYPEPAG